MAKRRPFAFPAEHPHHYPQPNEEGIAKVQEIYRRKQGREITHDEAYKVLHSVMSYIWSINLALGNVAPHDEPPASESLGNEPEASA